MTVNRMQDANRLADDLESLRTGRLASQEFREHWQVHEVSGLPNVIWPNLEHYLADVDIRKRDLAYRAMQDAEMEKLVRLLRAGAPDAELAKVTFLRHS
jgi:hypothetical protein